MKRPAKVMTVLAIAAMEGASGVYAADHFNLEEGLPVEVEDAYPIAYRGREIQGLARYERTDEGEDRVVLDPRLEFGFARNAQVKLTVPFFVGSAEDTNSGDVGLEAFYNFNQESLVLPAFAVSARGDFPTGEDSEGFDTTLKLIVSKTLGRSSLLHGVHLNLSWKHNADAEPDERDDYYVAVAGYSRRLTPDMMLVTDLVREEDKEAGKTSNLVELGARHQLTPLTLMAVGAGAGFGDESPEFRLSLGFQHSF